MAETPRTFIELCCNGRHRRGLHTILGSPELRQEGAFFRLKDAFAKFDELLDKPGDEALVADIPPRRQP
ncbi:MAG: hypothetical protein PHU71_02320 [Candidatus Gracilibacteria bacterium]|nr:hypothetical protein [Candidatus Gracilibacteria bacterium]